MPSRPTRWPCCQSRSRDPGWCGLHSAGQGTRHRIISGAVQVPPIARPEFLIPYGFLPLTAAPAFEEARIDDLPETTKAFGKSDWTIRHVRTLCDIAGLLCSGERTGY